MAAKHGIATREALRSRTRPSGHRRSGDNGPPAPTARSLQLDFNRCVERLIIEDTTGARAAGMTAAQRLIDEPRSRHHASACRGPGRRCAPPGPVLPADSTEWQGAGRKAADEDTAGLDRFRGQHAEPEVSV